MNHGREKGSRKKPLKTHRPGYKGSKRKKLLDAKARKLAAQERVAEAEKDLQLFLWNRFKVKADVDA